jgi:transposase-like protein
MLAVVADGCLENAGAKDGSPSLIDEIVREGARRMLAEAPQAEVDAYIAAFAAERDASGRRLVMRNGYHQGREVLTNAGAVRVTAPRVNGKRTDPASGERQRFSSAILPAWARKTPNVTEVLPLLHLHGLSSGDFVSALLQFLGSSAGLSAAVITKLTETWQAEQQAFAQRDMSGVDHVYVWADGIHVNIRLEEHKLCLLLMVGVCADGRKELIALADGYRESAESWADLLSDCARRGMRAVYGVKFPKAVAKITDEPDQLLAFFDCPCEHWVHLRANNPIEPTFATVRHCTKGTKGPGSRAAGLAMAFELIQSAQDRWRMVNAPHLVALVRAGARFEHGVLVERPEAAAA